MPDSAETVASEMLSADSTSAEAWAALAISGLELGDPASVAEVRASTAYALDSTASLPLVASGLSALRRDPGLALTRLSRAVDADSSSALAWAGLGDVQAEMDETMAATASYQRALEIRPDYLSAALELADAMADAGSPSESADFLRDYLRASGYDSREEALVRLGELLELSGDTTSAAALYDSLGTSSVRGLKRLGLIWERRGRWGRAIKTYRRVLEADPKDLWTHGELGLCFENVGRDDLARQWYETGLELDSSYAWAALRLGLMDYDAGSIDSAVGWLERATEADPTMIEAWVNLGLALDQLGRFAESADAYRRVVELDPTDGWAWGQLGYALEAVGEKEAAAEAYESGISHAPENSWLWQQRGLLYEDAGDYDSAIALFREAVERSSPSAWILGELGSLLARRGDSDSALACYAASVELDSCYLFGRMNLARMQAGDGRPAEALVSMEEYLACGGDSSIALTSMALYARDAGLDDRASELEAFVESALPDAWVTLAWSYYYSYMEEKATEVADSALVHHPGGVEGLLSLADLYMTLDRRQSAARCFERATKMDPDDPMPWIAWGSALYERELYGEAAERFRTALEIDDTSSEAWAYLGESLIFSDQLEEAREALQKAVELDPESVFAICYLGLVEERSGNPQAALDRYLKALRISPGYAYAESRIAVISDPSYDAGWWRLDSRPLTASVWLDLSAESGNVEERDFRGGLDVRMKLDGDGSAITLEGSGTLEEEGSRETRNTAWAQLTGSYFLTDGIYIEASSSWDRQPLTVRPWQVSSYAALGYKRWISDWAWLAPELGAGVVNSRWSWGEERTDELSSYASLGIWLEREGSLLPSLWVGAGLYSTPGQPDDLISDGNAEITFEAWRRISLSLGWAYDYTKTPVIPVWDSMDTETYLRLNLDLF
jgi:superkiller protein 3